MVFRRHYVEWVVLVFLTSVVAIVFYQINTAMTEEGIASGDAFHNAAYHPKVVAFVILSGVILRSFFLVREEASNTSFYLGQLARPFALLATFALFLAALNVLGYHLTATPFLIVVMLICGERRIWPMLLFSISIAFVTAFAFERYLKIVLPNGMFSINLGW